MAKNRGAGPRRQPSRRTAPALGVEEEARRELRRAERLELLATALGRSCVILSTSWPIYWIYRAVDALAGKSTVASFGITGTVTVAGLGAVVKMLSDRAKMKEQASELVRLRARCELLEKQVLED